MAQRGNIYKCNVCGNIVELQTFGGGDLTCCGESMELLKEKSGDVGTEKHTPVIEKTADGVKVKVGSVPHPMEDKHYIQWIEVDVDGAVYRQYLKPGQAPEAFFKVSGNKITAREYCNLHGLWKS